MINVIALTQFAFLALGIVALKILLHANTSLHISPTLQSLNHVSLWLFFIPVIWIAFASICQMLKNPLAVKIANALGVAIAIGCFLFLIVVTFFPFS